MFAVIAEGELYLRATASMEPAFRARGMVNMVYSKRGVPITLRYYWVDESLWRERNELVGLAWQAVRRPSGTAAQGRRPRQIEGAAEYRCQYGATVVASGYPQRL